MLSLREELEQRGFINQMTSEDFFDIYEKGGEHFYCGYDPTADSLHLGNLVTIMAAVNFMKKGNTFHLLIGGATGMIGDPGGRDTERDFLNEETLRHNQDAITTQVHNLLANLKKLSGQEFQFEVINNYDFYKDMSVLKFLRDVGKYMTVNTMMAKDIVKKRIEDPDKSISYTEFSYTLLQGYDFLHLLRTENIQLQISGSDQWGNITTGTELIRKLEDKEAYGMTAPLILDSTGKKFGKSEGNAIWIDKKKNSPYFVYQYFMNTSDEDVGRFLKLFTLLEIEEIESIVKEHNDAPEQRLGQKKLANYVVTTIFGEEEAKKSIGATNFFFGDEDRLQILEGLGGEEVDFLVNASSGEVISDEVFSVSLPIKLIDLCSRIGICSSNGEAKKLIKSGSIFLNEKKVSDVQLIVDKDYLVNGAVLLRKGKKKILVWNKFK